MKKLKILIVEDEALIAKDIEFSLRQLGYTITGIAYDGLEALEMIQRHRPDLVLLDIELKGGLSGIDIAHILNEQHKTPFIYLTSYADPDTIEKVKKTLPFGYVLKPFSERELYSAIELASYRLDNESRKFFPGIDRINGICLSPLTSREYEILVRLFEGKSNQEISEEYFISINTVKTHLKKIYAKLEVPNRHATLSKVYDLIIDQS
jgi:DNA-binding NarL/FixJ family response regulator